MLKIFVRAFSASSNNYTIGLLTRAPLRSLQKKTKKWWSSQSIVSNRDYWIYHPPPLSACLCLSLSVFLSILMTENMVDQRSKCNSSMSLHGLYEQTQSHDGPESGEAFCKVCLPGLVSPGKYNPRGSPTCLLWRLQEFTALTLLKENHISHDLAILRKRSTCNTLNHIYTSITCKAILYLFSPLSSFLFLELFPPIFRIGLPDFLHFPLGSSIYPYF